MIQIKEKANNFNWSVKYILPRQWKLISKMLEGLLNHQIELELYCHIFISVLKIFLLLWDITSVVFQNIILHICKVSTNNKRTDANLFIPYLQNVDLCSVLDAVEDINN